MILARCMLGGEADASCYSVDTKKAIGKHLAKEACGRIPQLHVCLGAIHPSIHPRTPGTAAVTEKQT